METMHYKAKCSLGLYSAYKYKVPFGFVCIWITITGVNFLCDCNNVSTLYHKDMLIFYTKLIMKNVSVGFKICTCENKVLYDFVKIIHTFVMFIYQMNNCDVLWK